MATILEKLGKDVLLVNDFAVPPNLAFLDHRGKVKQLGKHVTPEQLDDREVIIVLDTTAWIQLGKMADVVAGDPGHQARVGSSRQRKTIWGRPCSRTSSPKRPAVWSSRRPMPWGCR